MKEPINVTISIDDIHPEKGWGLPGDECMEYLDNLNKEFGAKFTLFIPSNYHGKYPLSKHKDWVDWLKSKEYFELAAHGHFHACERTDIGECEFFELDTTPKVINRLTLLLNEWKQVNHQPLGWRNPGWLTHPGAVELLSNTFKYAAVHYEHNRDLNWGNCKMLFGHDGIHETNIGLHNSNTVMFQSHIAGDWNDNVWNKENYEQLRLSLGYLTNNTYIVFKTLSEI
jgi:peptidoglycan/xylan/chitin deacetylase (PgdA/CDA1 family)